VRLVEATAFHSRASRGSDGQENHDSLRVLENHDCSTKPMGDKKQRPAESGKCELFGAILTFLHKKAGKKRNQTRS
jgi:hypothetical protein